ncbi:unnamed protein product [Symbiodinium sp. CCMP2592]|nr:unnamed protein product [Symbiodinium sp. CCMP2592]
MLLLCLLASLPICIVAHEEECSAALQVPRASTTTTTTEKQQHAFQIATASEKIGEPFTAKDVAEALATATQHLQRQHVLKLNDTCGECPVPDTRTECCVVWIQDGVEKKPERLELVGEMKKVIELRVTLHHEEGFDADLLRWVRTLHFDSADDRYQFLNKLRRDGIFEQSQLMSLNPFLMPTAKDVQLTSRLQQKAWIEQGKKQSSKEGEKARKEELSKKLQELESKNKDTREQMKAFYEAARSEAKASRAGLEEEAKKMQQEMAQRLEKLQLDASDTSMEDIRKQMSQLTETSGYLGGMSLPMVGLLHHMGVFRGVDLLADEMALGQHSQVVSLSPELASMDDEQLQRALQVAPDIAMEFTVETEFASDMQKVSTRLEAFGTSSFTSKSWQHSISAGGGMPLIFSVNTNGHWSGTESKGDATENKSEHGHQERDKVKSRQKMKCYEEPKARINLDHFMLVPSRSFSTAVAAISQELCRSESTNCSNFDRIQELLWTYGSHVCPQVVLGGRWTITAVYTSREATDKDDVSEMLSTAIDKVSAHSRGGGVGASAIFEAFQLGGGYSGEHQDGNSSHNHSSSGSRKLEQEAASQSHIRVEQVWTGGSSGLGPDGWRQSLDSVKNSNWKVIDRTLARCFGIWTWVDDIPTSEAICQQWVAQLGQMYSSDVKGAIETAALSMPDFPAKEVCQHTQKMRDFTDKELLRSWLSGVQASRMGLESAVSSTHPKWLAPIRVQCEDNWKDVRLASDKKWCIDLHNGANMVRPSDRFEAFLLSMHPWRRGPGDALQAVAETLKLPSAQVSKVQPKEGLWKEVDAKLANEASDEAYDVATAALAKAQQSPHLSSLTAATGSQQPHTTMPRFSTAAMGPARQRSPRPLRLVAAVAGTLLALYLGLPGSKHLKAAFLGSPGDSAMVRTKEGVLAPGPSRREGLAGLATSLALPLAGVPEPVRAEEAPPPRVWQMKLPEGWQVFQKFSVPPVTETRTKELLLAGDPAVGAEVKVLHIPLMTTPQDPQGTGALTLIEYFQIPFPRVGRKSVINVTAWARGDFSKRWDRT